MIVAALEETSERVFRSVTSARGASARGATDPVQRVSAHGWAVVAGASAAGIDVQRGAVVEGIFRPSDGDAPDAPLTAASVRAARGDFALVAPTADGLLLASGRGGGYRPIYVASTPAGPVACTRLAPLCDVFPTKPALNVEFLAAALSFVRPNPFPSATPFVGIERVPFDETWVVGRASRARESSIPNVRERARSGDARELSAALREALEAAIARSVTGARRFAVSTSGGVDSSALMALAWGLAKRGAVPADPLCCSYEFDTPSAGDDRPHVRSLSEYLAVDVERVRPSAAARGFRRDMIVDNMPALSGMSAICFELGRHARARGADVLLTGIGGDNVVDGFPMLLGDLARQGSPARALYTALRLRGPQLGSAASRVGSFVLRPFVAGLLPEGARARLRRARPSAAVFPWSGPRHAAHVRATDGTRAFPRPSLAWSPDDWYRALVTMPLFDEVNVMRAQEEIAGGYVRRDPYLDDDFLRFVATLPPLSLMHGHFQRGLLRETLRGLVPDEVRLRRTKAYMEPALLEMITAAGGFGALEDLVDVRMLADLGLVEPRAFRAHFEEIKRRPLDVGWRLMWSVLAIEAFVRDYDANGRAGGA